MIQDRIESSPDIGFAKIQDYDFRAANLNEIDVIPRAISLGISRMSGALVIAGVLLSACAPGPRVSDINDPNEARNRRMHEFNKTLDKSILKPVSKAYGTAARGPISKGVSNFARNLSLPGIVLNDLMQLRLDEALHNTARFALNSTFGVAGLFDVAKGNKLPERSTDFGETLHVWGFGEGKFVELPVFGASTQRDTVGLIVDFAINPTNFTLSKAQGNIGTASKLLKKMDDRNKYSDLVDSVYYGSEDSYAQSRLLYLQSRRRAIYGELTESDLEDPYAE
jgi:phospholipid-binding lipoprotein MlaA